MAATNFTPISLYYSSTASNVPTAGNLVAGELAINTADGRLYYKDSAGVVQVIGTKGGVGSSTTTQVLYNSSGLVVGSANMTFNGTTFTLANDASISGLTVGKGGGALSTNTAVGNNALAATNSGGYSVAVGQNAGAANTSGQITAVGNSALYTNTTGSQNTAIGISSLYANSTGGFNTAIGVGSLAANTTQNYSTSVGYYAGNANTTGQITAVGSQSLLANTTGANNVAVGILALQANTTASYNTAVGYQSLYNHTTGGNNTALGFYSGFAVTTGSNNLNLGYNSGAAITTGTDNITIGFQASNWSFGTTTGSGNIFIGTKSQPSANADSGELVISTGVGAVSGKGSNTGYIYVNGSVYQSNNSTLWAITSDQRLKKNIVDNNTGLDAINKIQVRNFEYRLPEEITEIPQDQAIQKTGVQLGAIAQELQAVLPECVKQESTGIYTVDADPLIWYLVNAVKELNAKITALENK